MAPAKIPPAITARLNKEIVQALNHADCAEALLKVGPEVCTGTPEALGAHLKAEYEKRGWLIQEIVIAVNGKVI